MTKKEKQGAMTAAEVIIATRPPLGHIEIRERKDGTYRVWYPDDNFIPCAPACKLQNAIKSHQHEYQQGMIESTYHPTDLEDAMSWAEYHSEGREVKLLQYLNIAERNKLSRAEKKAAKEEAEKAERARQIASGSESVGNEDDSPGAFGPGKVWNPAVFGDSPQRRDDKTVSTEGTFKRKGKK